MANFVRAANPIWIFRDLVGLPLNDEYYISFLQNTFPYLPQVVYRDNQGLVPWADPLELTPYGGLQPNVFFDDSKVYRLEIRHGATQADQLVYVVEDFVPDNGGVNPPSDNNGTEDNQASNPNFAFVNFGYIPPGTTPSLTLTVAGTYPIVPGWDLVLTGSGTITITQLIYTGKQNLPDGPVPPYALQFSSNSWTSVVLQQTLNGLGAIWYNKFVSMSVLARSGDGVARNLTLEYFPNPIGTPQVIGQGALVTGTAYGTIQGVIPLVNSTNETLNNAAYVNMQIILPPTGITEVGSVQIMGQSSLLPIPFAAAPDTTLERQFDQLFHYYGHELINKPKRSILVGWNFPLNPYQFVNLEVGVQTIPSVTGYVTDQTILHQEGTSLLQTGKAPANQRFGFLVRPVAGALQTATRFALIQYLDPASIRPYWSYVLSAFVRLRLSPSNSASKIRFKMRIITRTTLPPVTSPTEPISSWTANSDPVFAAGWTAISPEIDEVYIVPTASDPEGTNADIGFSFNGFKMPDMTSDTNMIGVVIYTMDNMNSITATLDSIVFDKISLTANKFAVECDPESFDEELRRCEFYYERSYDIGTRTGLGTALSERMCLQNLRFGNVANQWDMYTTPFLFNYKSTKRAIPGGANSILVWAPDGTANAVVCEIYDSSSATPFNPVAASLASIGAWAPFYRGTSSVTYVPNSALNLVAFPGFDISQYSGIIRFQYIIDARLGV